MASASLIKPKGEAVMFDTNKGMEEAAAFWDAGHECQEEPLSVGHVAPLC